jgi:hypothetical protein
MVKRGVLAVVGAILAVLAVRWVAVSVIAVPPEFQPLALPSAAIFFTVVVGPAAVIVFAVVRRIAGQPVRTFRWIAAAVLLLSFAPDAWLLSDAAAEAFPGATPAAVVALMVLHVVAAAVIVPTLTLGVEEKEVSS